MNLDFIPPKIWRFLPAADETVSVMTSRDLDSPLTERERAAIDEWLLTNLSFHMMRDHPQHKAPMMGGMWAFRVEYDRQFSRLIRSKLFNQSIITRYPLNTDQQFLADHVWPYAKYYIMTHDSYWCSDTDWNRHHRAFPTQRLTNNVTNYCFIGCPKPCCLHANDFHQLPCPIACRPRDHQDWTFC
ncbi:unnamed protein product [Adineta ricciae]|nr:unnamed protein product [Adineta ricciae]